MPSDVEILATLEASKEQWQFRSRVGSHQYLRLYALTRRYITPGSSVLDWGAASGHFSYFLTRLGYRATGFSLYEEQIPGALLDEGYRLVVGDPSDPVALPFEDDAFDAVASIGVLEHVRETGGTEDGSLKEIRRVLRPGGVFLCFHLPNRYSWIDAVVRIFRRSASHRYRYTRRDIGQLVSNAHLELVESGRYAQLPRNPLYELLPSRLASSEHFARFYDAVDAALGRLAPWICTNHYFVARTPDAPAAHAPRPGTSTASNGHRVDMKRRREVEADPFAGRVAIVVTCFDDGETLGEAVASIRAGASGAELVIVDDGSTDDDSLQALSRLEEDGVRVIHQPNCGPAAAAMAGVRATSSPYVMRFDADDLLEPGAADALADALDREADVAAAWGDMQTFGLTDFRVPGVPALDPWLVTYTNCIPGAGVLFRREALVAVSGWELRDGFEDWDLWMKLAECGHRGVHIKRVTFRYRRDLGGRFMSSAKETTRFYDQLRSRHKKLFELRNENRAESAAPLVLKLLVPMTEVIPGLSRLTRINLCELFTRLFWGGGLRATAPMVRDAASLRLRRRFPLRRG